jgi:hypothetical protein
MYTIIQFGCLGIFSFYIADSGVASSFLQAGQLVLAGNSRVAAEYHQLIASIRAVHIYQAEIIVTEKCFSEWEI